MSYSRGYSRSNVGFRGRSSGGGSFRGTKNTFSQNQRGRYFSSQSSNYDSRSSANYNPIDIERYGRVMSKSFGDEPYQHRSSFREEYASRAYVSRHSPEPPRKKMKSDLTSYSGASSRRSEEGSFGGGSYREYSRDDMLQLSKSSCYEGSRGLRSSLRKHSHEGLPPTRLPSSSSSLRGRAYSSLRRGGGPPVSLGGRRTIGPSSFLTRRRGASDTFFRKRYLRSRDPGDRFFKQKLLNKRKILQSEIKLARSDDEDYSVDEDEVDKRERIVDTGDVEDVSSEEGREAVDIEEGEVDEDSESRVEKKVSLKNIGNTKVENDDTLTDFLGQPYIKLFCPHCGFIAITFQEYHRHLRLRKHQTAMSVVCGRLRQTLKRMRMDQRIKQKALDESASDHTDNLKSLFCKVCKLNYRTLKLEHIDTRAHRKMLEFLFPFCKTCKISFRTPLLYEMHICELKHIKRKARLERQKFSSNETESKYMVVDSVGSGDESDKEKEKPQLKLKPNEIEIKKTKKQEPKLGSEHCRIMEAVYCDLCKIFFPFSEKRKSIELHCEQKSHLKAWMRETKVKKSLKIPYTGRKLEVKKEEIVANQKREYRKEVDNEEGRVGAFLEKENRSVDRERSEDESEEEREREMKDEEYEEGENEEREEGEIEGGEGINGEEPVSDDEDYEEAGGLRSRMGAVKRRYDKFQHDKSVMVLTKKSSREQKKINPTSIYKAGNSGKLKSEK